MDNELVEVSKQNIINMVTEAVIKILEEKCTLIDIDELMEYMWLKPKITGLNVDIFVDDCGSYERYNHPLLLWARNGYDRSVSEFIPFLISNKPIILNTDIEYHITYNDIFAIQDFIQYNLSNLIKLPSDLISQIDFVKSIKVPNYSIQENVDIINETSTLKAKDSGLPMDLWLDEGGNYIGHAPRLKFRASNEQRTTREFSSMLLTNPPTIENFPKDSPLKKKDLDKLRKFVVDNLDLLLKLFNNEIDYATEFLPNVKF